MKARLQAVAAFLVLLLVGALVGSAVSQWDSIAPVIRRSGSEASQQGRVRVEVLNGVGAIGAARTATDRLRNRGFDVVFFGNEGTFDRDSSLVLDRTERLVAARAVADALGIRNVRSEPDSNLYLDVSVLLGRDWEGLAAGIEEEDAEHRGWWDPRGWIGR